MTVFKKKVLIVGGSGFIGSHLHRQLPDAIVVDLQRGVDFLYVKPYQVDVIVFLAVDMGRTRKAHEYNDNLYAALDHWLRFFPKTHVIYTSSAAVYGDGRKAWKETDIPEPVNWYGKAKLLGECHVQQYRKYTILRLANVFGDGGSGAVDLFQNGVNTIYGTGYDTRDYVSVRLVCEVIVNAIQNPFKWQGITNVSTGEGMTTREVYTVYGHGKPVYKEARDGDVRCSVLDNSKLERLL